MSENFQSGKTQAIDLDELHVTAANRPSEMRVRGEFELDKWGDDPWSSTEESRSRRRWADDERWYGDDEAKKNEPEQKWDADEESLKSGWKAPKRGDVLLASEGWDDWDNFGGAPKELVQEQESKDFGGYRRVQAASQYAQVDSSNYADGHAQRDDLYQSKEVFGTSGVRERKGDPYADMMQRQNMPMPEMKPVGEEWGNMPTASPSNRADKENAQANEDDMRASAKISASAQTGDDIPGVTRASIIIFQTDTEPVIFELKKITTSIGRGLDNMVILNDQYASRRHLTINYVSGRFELFALSVDNLASVNGYPIRHIVLMNNDQIEIGATRIKFVLGPISNDHMQLGAPVNGRPVHLDPPPQEVRSLKTTRKNLILLISIVSIVVFFVVTWLILMVVSKSGAGEQGAVSKNEAADESSGSEGGGEAEPKAAEPEIKLEREDVQVLEGMIEAYGFGVSRYRSSSSLLAGTRIQIQVTSEPSGARIYNEDGSLRGITPYESNERVRSGREEKWTIRLDGYDDQNVSVSLGADVAQKVSLVPEAKPEPPKPKTSSKPKSGGKKKSAEKPGNKRIGGRIMI